MNRLALVYACLVWLAIGCDTTPIVSQTAPPASASPSQLPPGVVAPQSLIDQAMHLGSIVLRVDEAKATLTTVSAFESGTGSVRNSPTPQQAIWVVAVRGEIRIDALMDLPHARCALFAYDAATGKARSMRAGPSAICDPYFK